MSTQRDQDFLQRLARRLFTSTRLSILIVEPDPGVAQQLAGALSRDHVVTVVGTATAALAAIRARLPTLVATELDLPDAFGLDLLTALHSRPATQSVLLLVLSRRTSIQDRPASERGRHLHSLRVVNTCGDGSASNGEWVASWLPVLHDLGSTSCSSASSSLSMAVPPLIKA